MRCVLSNPPSPLQRSRTRGSAESKLAHHEGRAVALNASTEPHSWECGERASGNAVAPYRSGFNGAALVGVRRAARLTAFITAGCSASTEPHSWECGELMGEESNPIKRILLQRSRTRGSAESGLHEVFVFNVGTASTEPHSWECGEHWVPG